MMARIKLASPVAVFVSLFALAALLIAPLAASAAPTPSSGPIEGGTNVTINGIHFVQITAADSHSMGLTSEGTVFTWGSNTFGQLGDGSSTSSSVPVQVLAGEQGSGYLSKVTSIDASQNFSLASTSDGQVYSWGENGLGQLGNGTTTLSRVPVRVLAGEQGAGFLSDIASVAVGFRHSIALTTTGSVFTWGGNGSGGLGNGTTIGSTTPVQVHAVAPGSGSLSGIKAIAGAGFYTLAITAADGVVGWGDNLNGQLGNDTTAVQSLPVQVVSGAQGGGTYLAHVTSIAGGYNHTVASTSDGSVYAWGYATEGELGNNSTVTSKVPVRVLGGAQGGTYLSGIASVSAGIYHSIAVSASGSVFTWGYNGSGQLGNTTAGSVSLAPIQVMGGAQGGTYLSGVAAVSGDQYLQSYALLSSGDIYSWGNNANGVLGDGSTVLRTTPVLGPNFRAVSVNFGQLPGTVLGASGSLWNVTSPAQAVGPVTLTATANVFGGGTPGVPATTSWSAGIFNYEAPPELASTGSSSTGLLALAGLLALMAGLAIRRILA
jgi:LPXTG-motif cell wall-anchored protein